MPKSNLSLSNKSGGLSDSQDQWGTYAISMLVLVKGIIIHLFLLMLRLFGRKTFFAKKPFQWILLTGLYVYTSMVCRRSRFKGKRKPQDVMDNDGVAIHEGVKTIGVENYCDFSAGSTPDICICIVTWNMNGQVKTFLYSVSDFSKLIR